MERFRLEKVLNYRRALESMAQQELAAAQQLEEKLRLELATGRERLAAINEEFEGRKRSGLTAEELLLYQGHLNRQAEILAKQQESRNLARRDVDWRRQQLVAACKDKRLLEKLKQKKDEDFHRELLRKENSVFDEIGIRQFHKE